jgi:hypothetical protein
MNPVQQSPVLAPGYVTDTYQNTVRRVDKSSPYSVTTISGVAKAFSDPTLGVGGAIDSPGTPSFFSPIGITTNGVNLFVAVDNLFPFRMPLRYDNVVSAPVILSGNPKYRKRLD